MDTKKDVKSVVGEIAAKFHNSIRDEQIDKFAKQVSGWCKENSLEPGCKPEDVYTFLAVDAAGFKTALYERLYPGTEPKVMSAYLVWGKIYRQIGHLMDDMFPGGGCQDRSRYLANCYVEYMKTGKLPVFPDPETHFWVPPVGSSKEWMALCDGVMRQELSNDGFSYATALCQFMTAHPAIMGDRR